MTTVCGVMKYVMCVFCHRLNMMCFPFPLMNGNSSILEIFATKHVLTYSSRTLLCGTLKARSVLRGGEYYSKSKSCLGNAWLQTRRGTIFRSSPLLQTMLVSCELLIPLIFTRIEPSACLRRLFIPCCDQPHSRRIYGRRSTVIYSLRTHTHSTP